VSGKGNPAKGEAERSGTPDVEIGASAKAKRLRFDSIPETDVQSRGDERSFSKGERVNLPDEVEPGVEYRDVEARWLAAAYVDVREASSAKRRKR
jgi:hypothetical protein